MFNWTTGIYLGSCYVVGRQQFPMPHLVYPGSTAECVLSRLISTILKAQSDTAYSARAFFFNNMKFEWRRLGHDPTVSPALNSYDVRSFEFDDIPEVSRDSYTFPLLPPALSCRSSTCSNTHCVLPTIRAADPRWSVARPFSVHIRAARPPARGAPGTLSQSLA